VNSNIISVSFFFRTMRSYLPSLDVFNVKKYLNMNEANNKKRVKKNRVKENDKKKYVLDRYKRYMSTEF